MKKYIKHVIITLATIVILWVLYMNGCNQTVTEYEPKSDKVKDSLRLVIDSIQNKYDSALIKIDSLEVEKDGVMTNINQRKEEYDKSTQRFTENDADTAFSYIIAFLDSTERRADLQFHIDTSKTDSNTVRP